eukprot:jgi/Tetstr1/427386/TSEL_017550.t1
MAPPSSGRELHFAYGANLASRTLLRRGVVPAGGSRSASLSDASLRLSFQHRGGYATLVRDGKSGADGRLPCVYGALYELEEEDLLTLIRAEGGYFLGKVAVQVIGDCSTIDGGGEPPVLMASTFLSHPLRLLAAEVPPTPRYLKLIRDGARERGLPRDYQDWLASIQPAEMTGRGLGAEYYDSPQKWLDWAAAAIAASAVGTVLAGLLPLP